MKFQRYSDKCFAVISDGPEETYLAGTALGRVVYPGLLILLKGTLGMGKTKLAQGIGHTLGYERVKSPTFIIMSEYEDTVPFLHVDLYRLEEEAEIDSLGIEEYLEDGYAAVVEWADRWPEAPENGRIDIEFETAPGGCESRMLTFTCHGDGPREAFERLAEEIKSMGMTK